MSKSKGKTLATVSFFSVLTFVIGVALDVLYFVLPFFKTEEGQLWAKICMWVGPSLTFVGLVAILVCIGLYRREDKRQKTSEGQRLEDLKRDAEQQATLGTAYQPESQVTYIPSREAYEFIHMGNYQTLEEKFDEIGKMDKTQFVIYVARLFSRKGYQVKLTPVIDNHDVDLLVEKMGVTIAVGCILTNRILCQEDVVCIKNGKHFYGVSNCMALTNMYFDRTALDYAKAEHMSLVDRNILAEDFMS